MDWKMFIPFLPMILMSAGMMFKNKDADSVGKDDAFGNVLNALAPAVSAYQSNNENALKKSLRVVRDTINNYLGE